MAGPTATVEPEVVALLGIPIDCLDRQETVARIEALVEAARADGRLRQVATVNVDFLVTTHGWGIGSPRHPELLQVLRRADLITPDGMPILWLSRLLGAPLPERVTGSDLVPELAERAARAGLTVALICCQDPIQARATAEHLERRYPGLQVVAAEAPRIAITGAALADTEAEDARICERINACRPDLLWVGLGHPKQELWIARNRDRLRAGVAMGIGGSLDFLAGRVRRAPPWMQRRGLEWLFRTVQEPGRLTRRYVLGGLKLVLLTRLVLAVRWHGLRPGRRARWTAPYEPWGAVRVVAFPERVDAAWVRRQSALRDETVAAGKAPLVIDLQATRWMDSTAMGRIVRLWKQARASGQALYFVGGDHPALQRLLESARIRDLIEPQRLPPGEDPADPVPAVGSALTVSVEDHAGFREVRLSGSLEAERLRTLAPVDLLGSDEPPEPLLIDARALDSVDSAGLGFLIRVQRGATAGMAVFGGPPMMWPLLKVTRLDAVLPRFPDRRSALGGLGVSGAAPGDERGRVRSGHERE